MIIISIGSRFERLTLLIQTGGNLNKFNKLQNFSNLEAADA